MSEILERAFERTYPDRAMDCARNDTFMQLEPRKVSTLHPNLMAADLALAIADEACRVDIETKAMHVPANYPHPVFDTEHLDGFIDDEEIVDANKAAVARAVKYLDMRRKLVRPIPGYPQFVSFVEAEENGRG